MEFEMQSPLPRLNLLKSFFARIDDGTLYDNDQDAFRALRREVSGAFADLLLHHRPFLEERVGLSWPYNELARRVDLVESSASEGKTPSVRQQARLLLALLPFPGQWQWLQRAAEDMGESPEVKEFLSLEQDKLAARIRKKNPREFKLHNFCQILKRPNLPGEKGILRIFSLPYLVADAALLRRLNRLYLLYIEPPWGVVMRHSWLRAFAQMADPGIIGVGGEEDANFLAGQPGIVTTRLAHGDFLEEEPLPPARPNEYDLVFNATFDEMERKRHDFMLGLLARPPLHRLTTLFIGRGSLANVDIFRARVRELGLAGRVAVLANLRRGEVPDHLVRCRVGVLTSLNENGCRSIYEYLRADLPCIVSSSMAGFNFAVINRHTGMVSSDRDLPYAILATLRHRREYSPRAWFLNHSGSRLSSLRLNGEMRDLFHRLGYSWRTDIVPLGSGGATRYTSTSDFCIFKPEFAQLLEIMRPFVPVRLSV